MKKLIITLIVLVVAVVSFLFLHSTSRSSAKTIPKDVTVVSNNDFTVFIAGPIMSGTNKIAASNISFTFDSKDK